MKGINPLLHGLGDYYGSSGSLYGTAGQGSSSALSILGSTSSGTNISNQAKGISQLYSMLKNGSSKNALAGLNQTVKTLIHDTDTSSLQDFVTLGLGSVITGKKDTFTKLMSTVSTLDAKGETAVGITLVKQAAKTYADKGAAITGKFIDTASNLSERKFSNDAERKSLVGGFVATWSSIRTFTKKSSEVPDLNTFAKKADSLDNTSLKTYLAKIDAAIKKAGTTKS